VTAKKAKIKQTYKSQTYPKFKTVNGNHPLKAIGDDYSVEYKVRKRHGGKVAAFNFDLAKEIGLIPQGHPNQMNPDLEASILDTFAIIIINEFDQMNNRKFPEEDIKKHTYMATRYLQLQHPTKLGKTSGDGRSIWNGQVKHKGRSWDISSCGTGATRLSPATHTKNKFFESGDPTISYGCGYSEIDEGMAALFFSEILHANNVGTERVLGLIEFEKGYSVNIRVHENLMRPSHIFNHLKQGNYDTLSSLVSHYIDTQEKNKTWSKVPKKETDRLDFFLDRQSEVFAKMAADFEDEYIFCWLDWDGDNILMDGSIIDYGSVRQFGLYHSEYRYDDVERFSTSIIEQKSKARYIVQTFAQIVDYLKSKEKKTIKEFTNDKCLKNFDEKFIQYKDEKILYKVGFSKKHSDFLLKKDLKLVQKFRKAFSYFEMAKSKKGVEKVADGINRSAIFCMRDILRELPQLYLTRNEFITQDEFIEIIKSNYATKKDLEDTAYRKKQLSDFQKYYWELVRKTAKGMRQSESKVLLDVSIRSSIVNKYDRVTGDSITTIVDRLMKKRPKINSEELYEIMKEFTQFQTLDPDQDRSTSSEERRPSKFMTGMFKIVREYREGL
jgi:hypothetical protein